MSNIYKPLLVIKTRLQKNPTKEKRLAIFLRLQPKESIRAEHPASVIEIMELKPAHTKAKKNIKPKKLEAGKKLTALGIVTKARPTPESTTSLTITPCSTAILPNTPKTIIPAKRLKPQLIKAVINPLLLISDFPGK